MVPGVPLHIRASRTELKAQQGESVASKLKRRRRQLGLNCTKAAALLGVTRWTLGLWEQGRQKPAAKYGPAIDRFLK